MSNSDIKERFTNYILLLIVCLRNMEQFSWNPDHLWVLFPDVVMVIASEVAVDVVKHAFITKFNDISADVYGEYRASLAFDLVSSRQKNAYTDYSDSVSRRMGFIPLPLALLLIRVVTSSVKIQGSLSFMCVLLFYLGMITLKVLNSIVLLGTSCVFVKEANMEEKLSDPPPSAVSSRANSRAHRTKHVHTAPQQEPTTEKAGIPLASGVHFSSQAADMAESSAPTLPKSDSDTFLTTPDEDDDKIINANTGLEGDGLEHRTPKKDLLEIDRFTICGNRIDWMPCITTSKCPRKTARFRDQTMGHGACSDWTYFCAPDPWSIYLFITDKTSQGIKLLLRASEAASDFPSGPVCAPWTRWTLVLVVLATCRQAWWWQWWWAGWHGKLEQNAKNRSKIWKCETMGRRVIIDHRNMTAGLCEYVFKSTI